MFQFVLVRVIVIVSLYIVPFDLSKYPHNELETVLANTHSFMIKNLFLVLDSDYDYEHRCAEHEHDFSLWQISALHFCNFMDYKITNL